MNGKSPSRQDTIAFLLLLVTVIWFDREMVSTNQVPFFRDLGPFFYPMRFSLAESFKAGELPLWNRHTAMGFPLLANFQSGAFYPPNILFLFLPFFGAVRAVFLLHYLVAASGSYMLCRHWQYPPYLAIIGALVFTLGGTIVSLSNLMNHFQTAVWLPWVVLMGERAFRSSSKKDFLALTVALLVQFLAGSPELYAMSMGLLLVDGLRLKTADKSVSYRKTSSILIAANVVVVGLAMIQVLPTIELVLESRGPVPDHYSVASLWSLRPVSLINVFFPYGEVDKSMVSGIRLFFRLDIPFLISHYMGAITLFGICLWCFYGSLKEKGILLGLLLSSLIMALGDHTPIFPFLYQSVPFLKLFRFPEKFFFVTHALLVFMTLRGLNGFVKDDHPSPRGSLVVLFSLPILLSLLYLFTRVETVSLSRFIAWATGTPLYFPPMLKSASGVLFYLERQIALVFGILLLLILWKKGKLRSTLFQPLIVALVLLDLNSANRPYRFLLDPGFVFQGQKAITNPDPQPHRLFYYPDPTNIHPAHYITHERQSFSELYSMMTENLLPNTGLFHGFDYMQELDALRRWRYRVFVDVANALPPDRQYRLLGALNVKYISSLRPLPPGDVSLIRHLPEYPSWVYRLNGGIPRVYIVSQASEEKDPVKVLDRLSSLEFDPLKEVILEEPISIPTNGNFRSQAEIVRYENQFVIIKASLNSPGILVLADTHYPGWQVYVDGKEKEILHANLFFRGVSLSQGKHVVEFRYEPLSFTIGMIISLMTLFSIVIWSILVFAINGKKDKLAKP